MALGCFTIAAVCDKLCLNRGAIHVAHAVIRRGKESQTLWDTSRAQPGDAGIITNYLGAKPGLTDAKSALEAFRADLPKMSQKMADSLDPNAVSSWFWAVYPFTLGSYASAKVGQYTTLLDVASEPALGGRLHPASTRAASSWAL